MVKRRWLILGRCFSLLVVVAFFIPTALSAATLQELQEEQRQAAEEAEKYRRLQQEKQQEAETYEGQIVKTESQIRFVQSAIRSTSAKITEKEGQITATAGEIATRESELAGLQESQNQAIITLYEMGNPSIVEMIAGAKTFSEYIDRVTNLEALEDYLEGLIEHVSNLKEELENKKGNLEHQKEDLTTLKGQQQAQKANLDDEKRRKDYLLDQARKKEKTYDQLAEEAELHKQEFDRQIAAILRRGGVIRKGKIKRGTVIGYMGNTGFSTGPHLHFGIIRNGVYIDPREVAGKGSNIWPLNSFYVTQEFGPANWRNRLYTFHNGRDIVDHEGAGAPVYAMADGEIIEPFPDYNGCMVGGYGLYAAVDHGDVITIYAHLAGNCR